MQLWQQRHDGFVGSCARRPFESSPRAALTGFIYWHAETIRFNQVTNSAGTIAAAALRNQSFTVAGQTELFDCLGFYNLGDLHFSISTNVTGIFHNLAFHCVETCSVAICAGAAASR